MDTLTLNEVWFKSFSQNYPIAWELFLDYTLPNITKANRSWMIESVMVQTLLRTGNIKLAHAKAVATASLV